MVHSRGVTVIVGFAMAVELAHRDRRRDMINQM